MTDPERIAELEGQVEQLRAELSIEHNGARMLARFVLNNLPKKHMTHEHGELEREANGVMDKDVPATTPWLIKMMEVARQDIHELPQLLFREKETVSKLREQLAQAQAEGEAFKADVLTDLRYRLHAYSPDIFIEPPAGEHGETIDACSARALRWLLSNLIEQIEGMESNGQPILDELARLKERVSVATKILTDAESVFTDSDVRVQTQSIPADFLVHGWIQRVKDFLNPRGPARREG